MATSEEGSARPDWANPAVVGLMGFGLTTMATGLATTGNLGVGDSPQLGLALVFGGTAQLIAGIIALRKGEIFGGSAFVGYGAFWLAVFAMVALFPGPFFVSAGIVMLGHGLLAFWILWTFFTFSFLINSPKHGYGLFAVFSLLFLAFLMLDGIQVLVAYGDSTTNMAIATGWVIFATGLAAWYVATAILTHVNYGKKILPY
jgi:hypothetical protein